MTNDERAKMAILLLVIIIVFGVLAAKLIDAQAQRDKLVSEETVGVLRRFGLCRVIDTAEANDGKTVVTLSCEE